MCCYFVRVILRAHSVFSTINKPEILFILNLECPDGLSSTPNNAHLHWCFSYFCFESLSMSFKDSKAEQTTSGAFFPTPSSTCTHTDHSKSLHFFDQLFKYCSACAGVLSEPCWLHVRRSPMPAAVHMGSLHNASRSSACEKPNCQQHFNLGDRAECSPTTVCRCLPVHW